MEEVQGQIKSKVSLSGSWLAREVIGVPTRLPSGLFLLSQPSSSLTFPVGPNTYRMCPSSPLPSLAKSFPPASALLMLQSLQHGRHPPPKVYLKLVTVYFVSVLRLILFTSTSVIPHFLFTLVSSAQTSLYSLQHQARFRSRCFSIVRSHGRFVCGALFLIVDAFRYSV